MRCPRICMQRIAAYDEYELSSMLLLLLLLQNDGECATQWQSNAYKRQIVIRFQIFHIVVVEAFFWILQSHLIFSCLFLGIKCFVCRSFSTCCKCSWCFYNIYVISHRFTSAAQHYGILLCMKIVFAICNILIYMYLYII